MTEQECATEMVVYAKMPDVGVKIGKHQEGLEPETAQRRRSGAQVRRRQAHNRTIIQIFYTLENREITTSEHLSSAKLYKKVISRISGDEEMFLQSEIQVARKSKARRGPHRLS
jgi:hypothetical protein